MFQQVQNAKFPLGRVTVTADARALIPASEIARAISRHGQGDWGEVDEETKSENEGGNWLREAFHLLKVSDQPRRLFPGHDAPRPAAAPCHVGDS